MATNKKTTTTGNVTAIKVRMYRIGTGDFFLLQFKKGTKVGFNMMIDCGCINGGKADFTDKVEDLKKTTGGVIDLLVVTHEHADHMNGFQYASEIFKDIQVNEAWLAWTEEDEEFANKFRKDHAKIKIALHQATLKLNKLAKNGDFEKVYKGDKNSGLMVKAAKHFVSSLTGLTSLNGDVNGLSLSSIPTMEDILRKHKVIKADTKVEFWSPGTTIEKVKGAEGIRFFVLGPPKDNDLIKQEEIKGEGYEKREHKSIPLEMAFLNVFNNDSSDATGNLLPFDEKFVQVEKHTVIENYKADTWRNIDNEWLFTAGALALRHETSINNTSLALAIQFKDSERVLLFPGDAEQGSWLSWHQEGLEWKFKDKDNKTQKVNAEYLLNNTVFYKVGHHLSQNGTAKRKGLEMMIHEDLAAMATLDFRKINSGWLNTMPNDLIGEELVRKTKGRLFFLGDRKKILKNLSTSRVTLSKANLARIESLNKKFDGEFYIDYEVTG